MDTVHTIQLNDEPHEIQVGQTLFDLLESLQLLAEMVAVERNGAVVPRQQWHECRLEAGDRLEVVRFVRGGSSDLAPDELIPPLVIGKYQFRSRLMVGTGKYSSLELMRDCLLASGTDCVTVAVRRVNQGEKGSIFDYIDRQRFQILPNTAGCYTAEDTIRYARLAREMLNTDLVKVETLADERTLLPDPLQTLRATELLVKEGFTALVYTSDDPVLARQLQEAGAAAVMPAGSPIGSGQGVLNPNSIAIMLEEARVPIICDAGVGTASDVAVAMELGCAGILLNTAIAQAEDPLRMAHAMRLACDAGYLAARAGRIPRRRYANASTTMEGRLKPIH